MQRRRNKLVLRGCLHYPSAVHDRDLIGSGGHDPTLCEISIILTPFSSLSLFKLLYNLCLIDRIKGAGGLVTKYERRRIYHSRGYGDPSGTFRR